MAKIIRHNYEELKKNHEDAVNLISGYTYIKTSFKDDVLLNGKVLDGKRSYLRVKHEYCGHIYDVIAFNFIHKGMRCPNCCKRYENSFAHHIEVELGEPLEKYWDFDKNTVNPYYISKGSDKKAWFKCSKVEYHDSYFTYIKRFKNKHFCPYCYNRKVHPRDSFAQYHIDNTDPNFLEKYWDYEKNTLNPWEISPNSASKIWIKCVNEELNTLNGIRKMDYHNSYSIVSNDFTFGKRCPYCSSRKTHLYDSFGYHNFKVVQSIHPSNKNNLFITAPYSKTKFKFKCETCGYVFSKSAISFHCSESWCPICTSSKGEKRIDSWLRINNIKYEYEKIFDGLIGTKGGLLSYDFYLPNYNILIEYQGRQHKEYIPGLHKEYSDFKNQQEHDTRKREYAHKNNIQLLEIWHYDFDIIEEILEKELNLLNSQKSLRFA